MNANRLSLLLLLLPVLACAAEEATDEALYKTGDAVFQAATIRTIADNFRDADSINVIVKPAAKETVPVTLHLKNVPKYVILQYVGPAAGLHMRLTSFGAVLEQNPGPFPARPPSEALAASLRKRFAPQFEDAPLKDVVQYLAQVHGLNIVLVNPAEWQDRKMTLKLGELSVLQFLGYIPELYQVPVTLDRYAAVIGEKKAAPPPAPKEGRSAPPPATPTPRTP